MDAETMQLERQARDYVEEDPVCQALIKQAQLTYSEQEWRNFDKQPKPGYRTLNKTMLGIKV